VATILESFSIDSPQHGKSFKIDLVEGLDASHLDFIEAEWAPAIKRQYNLAMMQFFLLPKTDQTTEKWVEIMGEFGVQDYHWAWRTKSSDALGKNGRVFSLLNADEVEAATVVLLGENSRDPAASLPIVYVDFVAVAPWNRKAFQDPQRFRSLGTIMIGAAVELSRTLGRNGRCGLHSLPQSEGFYRHIGMTDFGPDASYESLRYFEFDTASATNFRT
jgi:hypothetical protein